MDNIKIFYINMKNQKDRDKKIQKQAKILDIQLNRVEPFSISDIKKIVKNYDTKLTYPECSLYYTIYNILYNNMNSNNHILILEDDIVFSKEIKSVFNIIEDYNFQNDEDMIFFEANLNIFYIEFMKDTLNHLKNQKKITFIDSKKYYLAGATAVLYNKNKIKKIIKLFEKNLFQFAYDLQLKQYIKTNQLKANILFPFFIGLNTKLAINSSLATINTSLLENSIRLREQFFIEDGEIDMKKRYNKALKIYLKTIKSYLLDD